ncbi:MAG: glutamate--cysteine ligase [Actinomycetota bacterium]|jgi:glutamate--cysteine ligase|nr:glutamate--cysteine ligase [Actinomycetota bacterium]
MHQQHNGTATAAPLPEILHWDADPDARATVRTEHDVIGFVTRTCFKTGPPGRVGLESEWFLEPRAGGTRFPDLLRLAEEAAPLPGGSLLSFEPGGQLELSTRCGDDFPHAQDLLTTDLARIDKLLADRGLRRVGVGVHPQRRPERVLRTPRYTAMERYFDRHGGPAGRQMMSTTAAVQVCLQAGADERDVRRRWSLVHALAPVLVASFAHSPLRGGRPTGWASTRQQIWAQLDPTRTRPVLPAGQSGEEVDPAEQWARYALDARVMLRRTTGDSWQVDPGMTLRGWVRGETTAPPPTYDDVAYHLSTLFPPVRPHAWLELRMIDALPDRLWPVAGAVTTALVDDPRAADAARAALEPLATAPDRHVGAGREALRDDTVHAAAVTCFRAATEALPRVGADRVLCDTVEAYAERYVDARRTPADELLDDWRSHADDDAGHDPGPGHRTREEDA